MAAAKLVVKPAAKGKDAAQDVKSGASPPALAEALAIARGGDDELSYEAVVAACQDALDDAWEADHPSAGSGYAPPMCSDRVTATFADAFLYQDEEGVLWRQAYHVDGTEVALDGDPVEQVLKPSDAPPGGEGEDDGMGMGEADFSTEEREHLAKTGAAMEGGGYPIRNAADLHNAISAFGRAKNPDAVKAHIRARAKSLGLMKLLPASWSDGESTASEALQEGRFSRALADHGFSPNGKGEGGAQRYGHEDGHTATVHMDGKGRERSMSVMHANGSAGRFMHAGDSPGRVQKILRRVTGKRPVAATEAALAEGQALIEWSAAGTLREAARFNRGANVIEGTVLIAPQSSNGVNRKRVYSEKALRQVAAMAEGLPAYANHVAPELAFKPRDVRDLIGRHRNVRYDPATGKVMSDLHVLEHQAPWVFSLAERMGDRIGNSLVSRGAVRMEGDTEHVDEILQIRSGDLVSDPATTKGLFEGEEGVDLGEDKDALGHGSYPRGESGAKVTYDAAREASLEVRRAEASAHAERTSNLVRIGQATASAAAAAHTEAAAAHRAFAREADARPNGSGHSEASVARDDANQHDKQAALHLKNTRLGGKKGKKQLGESDWGIDAELEQALAEAASAGSKVQTLIFSKDAYKSADAARGWAKAHGFSSEKVDETGESFRLRQAAPGGFDRMRTICLTPKDAKPGACEVSAVVGFTTQQEDRMEITDVVQWHRDNTDGSKLVCETLGLVPKADAAKLQEAAATVAPLTQERDALKAKTAELEKKVGDFEAGQALAAKRAKVLTTIEAHDLGKQFGRVTGVVSDKLKVLMEQADEADWASILDDRLAALKAVPTGTHPTSTLSEHRDPVTQDGRPVIPADAHRRLAAAL